MAIAVKRAYQAAAPSDGYRVLVDRWWPRGLANAALPLDECLKELAPSTALRQWFGHDAVRWEGFTVTMPASSMYSPTSGARWPNALCATASP